MKTDLKLTRDLRIAFSVDTPDHGRVHVHSLPLARFETFVLELGETYSKVFGSYDPKHVAMTAPQMALPALRLVSKRMGTWEGPDGVEAGLINELSRLTTVAHAGAAGWEQIPLHLALQRGILDEDTHAEVASSLVFIFLTLRVGPDVLREDTLRMASSARGWQYTSLGFTEYLASLPTSTPVASTTKKRSSVIG